MYELYPQSHTYAKSNERRVNSIRCMKKEFLYQKKLIQDALSNVDNGNKKVIFFDDGDDVFTKSEDSLRNQKKSCTKSLFEEEEELNEINFDQGYRQDSESTRKIVQLKSSLQSNERFKITTSFFDDNESNAIYDQEGNNPNENITYEDEKKKEFSLLVEVLGRGFQSESSKENHSGRKMLRYDPSEPGHAVYELETKKNKRNASNTEVDYNDEHNNEMPEVSKSIFYKVSDSLQSCFQEKNGSFSFLSELPENETGSLRDEICNELPSVFEDIKTSGETKTAASANEENEKFKIQNRPAVTLTPSEPFFFVNNDDRLREGQEFLARFELEQKPEFLKIRRSLKEIVRVKVRRCQKKSSFKKKLGGRKKSFKSRKLVKA